MKKKAEGMSLRETFAIHRRAARDMRRIAPGCFMPFILCAVVEAASPYAVIWLSARLVDELSTLRRPEILAKWVLWIVAVSAAAELLKAVLERWKNVRSELLDRQKEVLYTEKFLRMDYADCDRQETRDLFSQIRQNADWSGWGFAHLKLYYTQAVQGITGILGAAALTVSLFTRQVPTSAGKLTALNHPLFLVGILLLIAAVTCLGPALAAWVEPGMLGGGFVNLISNSIESAYSALRYPVVAALSAFVILLLLLLLGIMYLIARRLGALSSSASVFRG